MTAVNALWASIVRTIVPIVVGAVVGWLVSIGITLDPEFEVALTSALTGLFGAVYYVIVRVLEVHVTPKLGWLLGYAKQPIAYTPESPKS